MDRIWLNGSAERRRFLDRIVSNLVPGHTDNSIKYYKALKQRNKLIKEKILDSNWYDALEKQMAVSGAEIDKARSYVITYIMDMQKKSVSSFPFAELSIVGERYLTPQTLEMALCKNRKQDIYAGRTLIGPHLSDLSAIYSSKGVSARSCSTGEQKALLISIIIATAKIQIEVFNTSPILLLDEVSAHLDTERRNILYDELNKLIKKEKVQSKKEIEIFTNQSIEKINIALNKFRYNVIIAVFHEIYAYLKKLLEEDKNYENLKTNFEKILIVMSPVIPHIASECLNEIGLKNNIIWPQVNKEYLKTDEKVIVIQINGKKRNTIQLTNEIEEIELIEKIKKMKLVDKYIENKKIIKTIYIKNRLINIIIK